MSKAGQSKSAALVLQAEEKQLAILRAQKECNEHGIDPTLDPQERITRLIDIQHGSPHTVDETKRKNNYQLTNKG